MEYGILLRFDQLYYRYGIPRSTFSMQRRYLQINTTLGWTSIFVSIYLTQFITQLYTETFKLSVHSFTDTVRKKEGKTKLTAEMRWEKNWPLARYGVSLQRILNWAGIRLCCAGQPNIIIGYIVCIRDCIEDAVMRCYICVQLTLIIFVFDLTELQFKIFAEYIKWMIDQIELLVCLNAKIEPACTALCIASHLCTIHTVVNSFLFAGDRYGQTVKWAFGGSSKRTEVQIH